MAQGDVFRLSRTIQIDGVTHVNVMHFIDVAGASSDPENDLMDAWDNLPDPVNPEAKMQQCQKGFTSVVQVGLTCQKIAPIKGEVIGRGFETPFTDALDSGLPTFNQIKINIYTDNPSRSGKGGFYIGGIPETRTNGNNYSTDQNTQLLNLISTLLVRFVVGGSSFQGFAIGIWSELLQNFFAATSMAPAATIGSMVSRRAGRGV